MDALSTPHHTDPPPAPLRGGWGTTLGNLPDVDPQWWRRPADALAALERAAERDPADRRLAAAVRWAIDRVALEADTPAVIGGFRRERPIRWDGTSAVWIGADVARGEPRMVRILRPTAQKDPAWHRALVREARALAAVAPVAAVETELGPMLSLPLAGRPLAGARIAPAALARPAVTALAALARWEAGGLGLPEPVPEELRLTERGVAVACLWPVDGPVQPALTVVAALLLAAVRDRSRDPIDDVAEEELVARLRALAEHDSTAADAGRLVRQALAEGLAARRHALAAGKRAVLYRTRSARLLDALLRLDRAARAPSGRGAIGVDERGEPTAVRSDGAVVQFGAAADVALEPTVDATVVYEPSGGFRPAVARRMLRARALSTPLGDVAAADAICRWVAAGLQLRTVRLLLRREVG